MGGGLIKKVPSQGGTYLFLQQPLVSLHNFNSTTKFIEHIITALLPSKSTPLHQNCEDINSFNLRPRSVMGPKDEPRHEKSHLCYMQITKVQISQRIRDVWSLPG